jgi:transposase InsO family protein
MTGEVIAQQVKRPRATVGRILRQFGLGQLSSLRPKPTPIRYERDEPGDLIHVDIKKLGRFRRQGHRMTGDRRRDSPGAGWECAHVAVDDHSRLAFVEMLADEKELTVVSFFEEMLAWYSSMGLHVKRVMTDNGSAYRSRALRKLLEARGIRHLFTRPYRPQTNGKAERFIQSALREWAYRRPYATSAHRRRALPRWLHHYNYHRRHSSLHGRPPISRVNNLMSCDS